MKVKKSIEIIEDYNEENHQEGVYDAVFWVDVDDLIKHIEDCKSPDGDYPDADCIIRDLQKARGA